MNTETLTDLFAQRVHNVPQSFIREILKVAANPGIVSFAGGLPNPQLFPVKELEECAIRVFQKHGMQALQYAATEGYYPLREYVSGRYRDRFGLNIPAEQILITNGSQQALDLIGKLFIQPGDNIAVERPSYLGALQSFSMFEPHFKEATLQQDGIEPDELEQILSLYGCNLFYTIPNFQNPSGIRYSKEKRIKAAEIIKGKEVILIEDDPYGDISFTEEILPPIYSYVPEQSILLGSFSKIIAPGLRLGWMIANKEIIKKAAIMKQASDLHSGNLSQYILFEFLSNYNLEKHIEKLKTQYKKQRDMMVDSIEKYFPASVNYTKPEGGMFTWLTLPRGLTSRDLLKQALEKNIIFVPGDSFYASNPDTQTLRLNYSNVEGDLMKSALKILGEMIDR